MTTAVPKPPSKEMIFIAIGVLTIAAIIAMFTGCVSLSTNRRQIDMAYKKGLERSAEFMQRYNCEDATWLVESEISGAEMQEITR